MGDKIKEGLRDLILNMVVVVYTTFYDNEPIRMKMREVMDIIESDDLRQKTKVIRDNRAVANDEKASIVFRIKAKQVADKVKHQTPSIMTNVLCEGGKKRQHIKQFLPIIGFDIDDISTERTLELVEKLKQNPHMVFVQPSSSRHGLHGMMLIDCDGWLNDHWDGKHTDAFDYVWEQCRQYIEDLLGVKIDAKCKNPEHIFGLCADEASFFNADADPKHIDLSGFKPRQEPKTNEKVNNTKGNHQASMADVSGIIAKRLADENIVFEEGGRNDYVLRFASLCNAYGVQQSEVEDYAVDTFEESDFCSEEILRTVQSAYSYTDQHGTMSLKVDASEIGVDFTEETLKQLEALAADYRSKYLLDVTQQYAEKECVFEVDGVGFFANGELSAIKGKQKEGKSQTIAILNAANISGGWHRVKRVADSPVKTIYFDTEQHPADTSLLCQRTCQLSGTDFDNHYDWLMPYTLREVFEIDELKRIIVSQIIAEKPKLVFIDGVVDLIQDFNEVVESKNVMDWLGTLCSHFNIALVVVLHENKREEDKNMRGHLGTRLSQKATTTLQCSKDKKTGIFTVSSADTRRKPVNDWSFMFDANDNIVCADDTLELIVQKAKATKAEQKALEKKEIQDKHFSILSDIILQHNGIVSLTRLKKLYQSATGIKALNTCKNHIIELVECDRLFKSDDDLISLEPIPDTF